MKILAKTTNGVIAELTNDELARVLGYYSDYQVTDRLGREWNAIGKEYKTDERYEQLQALSSIPKQIKTLSGAMKDAQTAIDKAVALIEKSDISKVKDK